MEERARAIKKPSETVLSVKVPIDLAQKVREISRRTGIPQKILISNALRMLTESEAVRKIEKALKEAGFLLAGEQPDPEPA